MVRRLSNVLRRRAELITDRELRGRAMVFSPHPDDECLGCGGTILKMRQMGTPVTLVHMTDGSGSHAHAMPKRELAALRRQEAENAASALGINETVFLDFEDGQLSTLIDAGVSRVRELLERERPEAVFVPSRLEPRRQAADHLATTTMVERALDEWGGAVTVWEYPVWFWLHWPWVALRQTGPVAIKTRHVARNTLTLRAGLRAFGELTSVSDVGSVLAQKKAALAEHRSQLEQIRPGVEWATLGQVAGGEFLDRFLTPFEFFRRYEVHRAEDRRSA